MAMSDAKIRGVKPSGKQLKLFDGGGLFLLVTPKGGKLWRLKYRHEGKEKLLALGTYPEISLADARQRRDEARKQIAHSIDPSAVRKAMKEAETAETSTFEVIAREWHAKFATGSAGYAVAIMRRLEKDLFPWIGNRPIAEIKASDLLAALRRVEIRGALVSAHRTRTIAGQVFRYAVATGRAERDPSVDLKGALPPPGPKKHHAAITDPKEVGLFLRAIDGYNGYYVVRCALRLAPMLFVRPGELRHAEWTEIDIEAKEWNIPAHKMKMKEPHLVPLCRQAIEILTEMKELSPEGSKYVFPSCVGPGKKPISENTLNCAIRAMGYGKDTMTSHGFRAMARTILDEVLQVRPDFLEHQLAHAVRDVNGRAYNRTSHLEERRKMMQMWADYLDGLKAGADVTPSRGKSV